MTALEPFPFITYRQKTHTQKATAFSHLRAMLWRGQLRQGRGTKYTTFELLNKEKNRAFSSPSVF